MALASGTIFQVQATATTGNTNGSGFNIANANFVTDLASTNATSATPTVTSATYTFVAGDVNNYIYVSAGTHWQVGWYKITGVVAGAQLAAAVGQVITAISSLGVVTTNTTAGCTSDATASITAGTYGVDYSQTDSANSTITDAASAISSTTLTSVTAPWTPVSVGNFFHLTTTGTGAHGLVGWYEIVTYVSAGNVTTDRTTNNGTALVAGTGSTGGAGRLNGLEDTFQSGMPASAIVWVKNGSYTTSQNISTNNPNSTAATPIVWIGYNSTRGDICVGANRPALALGANGFTFSAHARVFNLIITGTGNPVVSGNDFTNNLLFYNCKITNTSSTASRTALSLGSANGRTSQLINSEIICQNGNAISSSAGGTRPILGCYIHDSATGDSNTGSDIIWGNIFAGCTTAAIVESAAADGNFITNNTIYGRSAQIGIGINLTEANSNPNYLINNILVGLTTGVSVNTGSSPSNFSQTNTFSNNGTDVSGWIKNPTDIALSPTFTGVSELTGTTATTLGSVLTDGGASFGVTDNIDFLHVVSGTGVTVGCYLITSHTSTTLTVNNALGTANAGDVVYWIGHGRNFQIGSNMVNAGFPTFINSTGSLTTSFPDIGAVIPQSSSSGASMLVNPGMTGGVRG